MVYEEYKNSISEIIKSPENAPILANELLEKIKVDCEVFDSQTEQLKKFENKIRDLQDTNIKLFINQTSNINKKTDETENLTGNDFLELFIDNALKEE